MRKIQAIAIALSLALLCAPYSVLAAAYQVAAEVKSGEIMHSVPVFGVDSAETAELSQPGQDGFSLSFTVSGAGPNTVKVEAVLTTEQGELAPTVIVPIGQPASVSIGKLQLNFTVVRAGL